MKKKSFFYGINAKMALTIVALSGALLTGCYKDDGLDVNGPTGSVTLPAAVYTLTGSVLDTDGNLVKDAIVTVAGGVVDAKTGSFTAAVKPGSVAIKVVPKDEAKYNTVEKTVTVLAVAAGQSVVYTETIVLTKKAVAPKVEAKYNLDVMVFAASNLVTELTPAEFKVTVKDAANAQVTDLTSVKAGIYNVVVTPTDATKYNTYTTMLSLPVVEVEAATPPAVNEAIPFTLYAVLTEKSNPIEYNVLSAFVSIEDGVEVTKMEITKGGEVVATTGANYIVYLAQKNSGDYKLTVNYTDNGFDRKEVRYFSETELAFAIILRSNQTLIKLEAGTTPLDANTTLTIDEGTTATLNGEAYTGSITLVRNVNSESNDNAVREYSAKPDRLIFSKPIHILFNDPFEGQLGLKLFYLENNEWIPNGDVTTTADGKFSMNVKHFSTFKAAVAFEIGDVSSQAKVDSTETIVGKKNDTDKTVSVKISYSYRQGRGSDVEAIVSNAGLTGKAAIYVTDLINGKTDASGIKTVQEIWETSVLPYTCLESIVKKEFTTFKTFPFTIDGKEMTVTTEEPERTILIPNTYTFGHGHGHSHGHGHGDDLNAGGGIIEAE